MSAYVVSKDTIDRLVQLAVEGPGEVPVSPDNAWHFGWYMADRDPRWRYVGHEHGIGGRADLATPDELGQLLISECVRSVRYRYPEDTFETLPGPVDNAFALDYHYARPARRLTAVEGLKLLDGYDYQSCEHPEWEASEAHAVRSYLRDMLISRLPGYSEAEWAA